MVCPLILISECDLPITLQKPQLVLQLLSLLQQEQQEQLVLECHPRSLPQMG